MTTPRSRFRVISITEGISFLVLLFIAMPLKYGLGMPIAVSIVGSIHGFLFIVLVGALIQVHLAERWPWKKTALGFVLSQVPFGPFWFDRRYLRNSVESPKEITAQPVK